MVATKEGSDACYMIVASYKGKGKLFNYLIRFWNKTPFSHNELVIDGVAYSSSFMDGGIRRKTIDFKPENWELDIIYCTPEAKARAKKWFEDRMYADYDVLGIITFLIGFIPQQRNKWFCSESVMEALGVAEAWRLNPAITKHIAKMLADKSKHILFS